MNDDKQCSPAALVPRPVCRPFLCGRLSSGAMAATVRTLARWAPATSSGLLKAPRRGGSSHLEPPSRRRAARRNKWSAGVGPKVRRSHLRAANGAHDRAQRATRTPQGWRARRGTSALARVCSLLRALRCAASPAPPSALVDSPASGRPSSAEPAPLHWPRTSAGRQPVASGRRELATALFAPVLWPPPLDRH